MSTMTLPELSKKMRDIDFTNMITRDERGALAGRPMSNNGDVEYEGDSYFFTWGASKKVADITRDPNVSLSFQGKGGLLGKPPIFIHVEGKAEIIRDKAVFAEHWQKDLDRWFEQGIDTPGIALLKVHASSIHYWDGEDEGELQVR